MEDIFTQGYVGVSRDPWSRFKAHVRNARVGDYYQLPELKNYLLSANSCFKIMLISDEDYCYELEANLRPKGYIGWNIRQGGRFGDTYSRLTHGLSKEDTVKWFYSQKQKYMSVCEEWSGRKGVEEFFRWASANMTELGENRDYLYIVDGGHISPENILLIPRIDMFLFNKEKYYSRVEGRELTISEWADYTGIRPNTISTRISRGWSVDESLNFRDRLVEKAPDWDKLEAMCLLENTLKTNNKIASDVGFNSTLKRLLKDYKLPNYVFEYADVTMPYGLWALRVPRKIAVDDFSDFIEIYDDYFMEHLSINAIAIKRGMNHSTVRHIVEEAENAEIIG